VATCPTAGGMAGTGGRQVRCRWLTQDCRGHTPPPDQNKWRWVNRWQVHRWWHGVCRWLWCTPGSGSGGGRHLLPIGHSFR